MRFTVNTHLGHRLSLSSLFKTETTSNKHSEKNQYDSKQNNSSNSCEDLFKIKIKIKVN